MAYVNTWGWAQAVKEILELVEGYKQTAKRLEEKRDGKLVKERIGA